MPSARKTRQDERVGAGSAGSEAGAPRAVLRKTFERIGRAPAALFTSRQFMCRKGTRWRRA